MRVNNEYISVGGNQHPAAADWDAASGLLAYGAGRNIALWLPLVYPVARYPIPVLIS